MSWRNPVVRKGTKWCMMVDVIHNLWYFTSLFMTVYLLDCIIRVDQTLIIVQDRTKQLMAYSVFAIFAVGVLHYLDYSKIQTGVGQARSFLQDAIIRKFLNYTPTARQQVTSADIVLGIRRDANDIHEAYILWSMSIISEWEKLGLMLVFKVVSPIAFGQKMEIPSMCLLLLFPALLGTFLVFRWQTIMRHLTKSHEAEEQLLDQVTCTTQHYSLVIDYERRSWAADIFHERLDSQSKCNRDAQRVLLNTMYFSKLVTTIIVGVYVIVGGLKIIDGTLRIGMFVMDLEIFKTFGQSFSKIFEQLVHIERTYPSMMKLFRLLNLKADDADHMTMKRRQRKLATEQRNDILAKSPGIIAVDVLPIVCHLQDNFRFGGTSHRQILNFHGRHEISQGQLVALVGRPISGKRTLLYLISQRLLPHSLDPDHGVFVPAHLRIITVCKDPVFYRGTLFDNLIFGMHPESPGADRKRVHKLCMKLQIDDKVMETLDRVEDWETIFSESERKLLNIARALIFNAEVMCLDKPLAQLEEHTQGRMVLQVLKEHIANRGLGLGSSTDMHRPRTVLYSTSTWDDTSIADSIFHLSRVRGLEAAVHENTVEKYKDTCARCGYKR
jgi:ABC-type multidrug transport system fused ATPase/permease subunit